VVREAVERGRGCRGELGLAELIEREPLTEEAARREMIADRREVLARVERSGAGLPRDEEGRAGGAGAPPASARACGQSGPPPPCHGTKRSATTASKRSPVSRRKLRASS